MTIKSWFLNENYSQSEKYAIETTEPTIEKGTEKAYFLKFNTDFGVIKGWFPKSVCKNEEEAKIGNNSTEIKVGTKAKSPDGKIFTVVGISCGGFIATADNGKEYLISKLEIVKE